MTKNNEGREKIHLIISFTNLIIILGVIIISIIFPSQEIFFNIVLSLPQYILFGMIFLFQIVFSIFVKYSSKNYPNAYLFDILSFIIFFSLLGIIFSINFLTLSSFFILAMLLIGMIFYFGEFKIEFSILKQYFIISALSIISIVLISLIVYIDAGTMQIINLEDISLSEIPITLISFLIILGFGVPCGLFPFYIIHLKKYFRECEYFHFVLLSAFNFISTLTIM